MSSARATSTAKVTTTARTRDQEKRKDRFTFSFDDCKCYMHEGNRRVEIFRKGRIFVLRMRHRWLKSTAHMIASIDEAATHGAANEEMGIAEESAHTDDGARAAVGAREDEPRGAIQHHHHHDHGRFDRVRCNKERKPYDSTTRRSAHIRASARCASLRKESVITVTGKRQRRVARVQMDFMFVGAAVTFVDQPRAKATVLMVV